MLGHVLIEQSLDDQPESQTQDPFTKQRPWYEQSLGHSYCEQSIPLNPREQQHVPLKHWPFPVQSLGQT